MTVVVITPAELVVDLDEIVKPHLHVEHDGDDALIAAYAAAAQGHIDGPDGWLGRAVGVQTLELRLDAFPACGLRLPYGPVTGLVSVKYDTEAGEQTLDPADYQLLASGEIALAPSASWPSVRSGREVVRVRYTAGYETPPPAIVAAILLMTGDLYANRETERDGTSAEVQMSTTVENLLAPFRIYA